MRVFIPAVLGAATLAGFVLPVTTLWSLMNSGGVIESEVPRIRIALSVSFAVALLGFSAAWLLFLIYLARPVEAVAREARMLASTPQSRDLLIPRYHVLDRLPRSVHDLALKLVATRAEIDGAVAQATDRAEEQKSRLEAILLDLTEGVIVCNFEHRILLYNQAAGRILGMREALGLGRPLFGLLTSEPVLHTLEQFPRMRSDPSGEAGAASADVEEATRRFVCATVDLGTLLEARLSLVREASGDASGYVLSFADVSQQVEELALRDNLLREVMVEWRRPIANLSAATEMLCAEQDLDDADRAAFEDIIRKETEALSQRFGEASRRYDRIAAGPWPMADVHSPDLFRAARKHLAEDAGIELTLVGVPLWLHVDSHSLLLAIEHLARRLAQSAAISQLDIEASRGDTHAYVEIAWQGAPIASAVLDSWLDQPLKGTIANRTVRQIIERHGSELWSLARPDGTACIRLPLQPAQRQSPGDLSYRASPRPEYYDFDLFRISDRSLDETPLKKLRYVVFDTETTGLRPSDGDELISIGAVRVVNGRILTGETFERLIDPGRDIPETSIRFHGITADMVKGKPPVRLVLPQFKSFVGDGVLVAYNAAFDMKFLELKQEETGAHFDNPVLDALLLTIFLHPDTPDHSLSSMAERLGIEITGRHTALGDAMATAAVWVRLLDLLEERGITTFGEAIKLSSRMMEERKLKF